MTTSRPHSFGKSLFFGDLREELLFPFPRLSMAAHKQTAQLLSSLQRLALDRPALADARCSDENAALSEEALVGARELGLFGLCIPRDYGGLGLPLQASCRILDAVGAMDPALSTLLAVHSGLCASAILHFGDAEQRRHHLPRLASGELLGAFCINEPTAGSDAGSARARARPQAGTQPPGYVLNGTKLWVTGGTLAQLFVLFAQTQVRREGSEVDRITGFLAERGPGLRPGAAEKTLGLRAIGATAVYLEDLQLPPSSVLGSLGGGFKVAMDTLNRGRLLVAAACLGQARELLRLAVQHATSRRQFGRLVSTLGMVKDKIARMAIDLYAAEAMLYLTTGLVDAQQAAHHGRRMAEVDYSLESASCKVMASEMLARAARTTMEVAASTGYRCDYPYERHLRDSGAFLIFPGTNEVLRCYIALTGLAGPGEQLDKLADAIKYPLRGYGLVVDSLIEKMRTAAYGRAQLTRHHPRLKKEAVAIEDATESLAREVDRVLRRHGRQISEMQYVQRRVSDVVIDLFAMCATVARASAALFERDARYARGGAGVVEAAGELDAGERELRLCSGFCGKASARIHESLSRFSQNDDELMKAIADDCYVGRPAPPDPVL
jgi:acyl-CoA dehydrogenase family protein 9